jgi:hypothetical protein
VTVYQVVKAFLNAQGTFTGKKETSHICATFCIEGTRDKLEDELVLVSQRLVLLTNAFLGGLEVWK